MPRYNWLVSCFADHPSFECQLTFGTSSALQKALLRLHIRSLALPTKKDFNTEEKQARSSDCANFFGNLRPKNYIHPAKRIQDKITGGMSKVRTPLQTIVAGIENLRNHLQVAVGRVLRLNARIHAANMRPKGDEERPAVQETSSATDLTVSKTFVGGGAAESGKLKKPIRFQISPA